MSADLDIAAIRHRSKAIFGGQYRVEVGAAIGKGDGIVCAKDLADHLGEPPGVGSVHGELKILERAGLLARTPRDPSSRKVYLIRQPSAYWGLCLELAGSSAPDAGTGAATPAESGLQAPQ